MLAAGRQRKRPDVLISVIINALASGAAAAGDTPCGLLVWREVKLRRGRVERIGSPCTTRRMLRFRIELSGFRRAKGRRMRSTAARTFLSRGDFGSEVRDPLVSRLDVTVSHIFGRRQDWTFPARFRFYGFRC